MALPIHQRWLIERDFREVLAIEAASFAEPWCEEDLQRVLRNRGAIGMVAEHAELLVGYYVYELQPQRIDLLNLAVHPAYRRRGIGRQCIEKLVFKLSPQRRRRILVSVPETALERQLFLRDCGFRAITIQRGQYEPTGEDCYLMQYRLPIRQTC